MSLDTVLQIGKVLRKSENSLKYFKYVEQCPKDKDGNWPICITIPVKEDFSFDWDGMKITPENQRDNLFYLKFKTSNADSSANKYLFGDIFYTRKTDIDRTGKIKEPKEFGNFTIENENAFYNGQKPYKEIVEKLFVDYVNDHSNDLSENGEVTKKINEFLRNFKKDKKSEFLTIESKGNIQIEKLFNEINDNSLIKFRSSFSLNLEKFNSILKYGPAFENIVIEDMKSVSIHLNDIKKLEDKYIQVIYQSVSDSVKKQLFGKHQKVILFDDLIKTLDGTARTKILQFADFKIFIHFEFENGKKWHSLKDAFNLLVEKLNSEITRKTDFGLVPDAYIYRTLCSGNLKNDWQFPNFEVAKAYKSFVFAKDEFDGFLYTSSFLERSFRRLHKTKIDLFIFPIALRGKEISHKLYDTFFEKKNEDLLQSEDDPLLFIIQNDKPENFSKFDFILSESSGQTTNDLIEISGIEQSDLKTISEKISKFASRTRVERKEAIGFDEKVRIENSFLNILGTYQVNKSGFLEVSENHRYKSHLLKVLPLIYMKNYRNDTLIVAAFIENIEKIVRLVKENVSGYRYERLKYDLFFLMQIQNNLNSILMEIFDSKSYQIGLGLGKLSKPLKKKINSFEKRYVGLLTRRVSTKEDCIEFSNEINEMLVRHDKKGGQLAAETIAKLVEISQKEYDKENVALGFFEGYFHYETTDDKRKLIERIERIISDYEGKENFQEEIQVLVTALEEIK